MARLIITHQGTVIKEYDLSKENVTVGRKPSNDIVLDDPTVSGLHAAFLHMQHTYVEDMNSTNGIKLNGKTISKRQLNHGDIIQIGQHEFKFIDDAVQDFEQTVVITPPVQQTKEEKKPVTASVVITQGAKAGEAIALNKPYTKLGSASQVAVIARRGESYYLMPMSGGGRGESPKLNGRQIGAESMLLSDGDLIEVATTELKFNLEL
ncbi:MAG: FHA domain-containing protein [Gammaproteobacteria bacterium]|nr:FHA domain-containing protein [Gammaproteobacteria bacterium]MCW8986645.1 FHA domain-containing protein [Gammaproteobacteria bacterium]MCW9030296.1 FHA domain-containing protein [Gammaproteobacteria bacterium]